MLYARGLSVADEQELIRSIDQPPNDALLPAIAEAKELFELGLLRESASALASGPREKMDDKSRRVAATLLQAFGRLPAAHRMAPLPWSGGLGKNRPVALQAARLAYPEVFPELVEGEARDPRVEPALLRAFMRVESGFDPKAHSPARARGLTQLMWGTARRVAAKHKIPLRRSWQLYDPTISIRVGSAYFGDLLDHFDGNLVLAIAAYNAGEAAVERWERRHLGQSLDELIEDIPFDETRRYVGRVLSFYAMYRLLEGRPLETMPLEATETLTLRRRGGR